MATSMEKKIAKLEVELLQPNIDIPESMLVVNPTVAQVIKRCCDDRVKVEVADFGDKVEDLTFLITLQNQVYYETVNYLSQQCSFLCNNVGLCGSRRSRR